MNFEFSLKQMGLMKFNSNRFALQEAILSQWQILQLNIVNILHYRTSERIMQVLSNIELYFEEDPEKTRFLDVTLSADFAIENIEAFSVEGKIEFPTPFISSIVGIMYSTIRGVILDKTIVSGSILLPLVNPDSLPREVIIVPPNTNEQKIEES